MKAAFPRVPRRSLRDRQFHPWLQPFAPLGRRREKREERREKREERREKREERREKREEGP
jgi:hypothetical protein